MTTRVHVMVITENSRLEQMTFALLHSSGCSPLLPGADETASEAIHRTRPDAVMLDCEHPAAVSDRFFELAHAYGIGVLIYGRDTREADVDLIARQQSVCKLMLPADGNLLQHAVLGAIPN